MVRLGHVTPAPPLIGQDAIRAVTNVDDYAGSAQALAATTLRNVLGTRTLGDILSDRVKIAQEMHVSCSETRLSQSTLLYQCQDLLAEGTLYWGVAVERVEVRPRLQPCMPL